MAANENVMVDLIKAYATEHYEKDGWDLVIETMTDEDIAKVLGKASTLRGAIWKMKKYNSTYVAYRDDIQATAF